MAHKAARGKWGTFLTRQRDVRNWTQVQAFDALRDGLGLGPNSRSSYVGLERGTRLPDPDQQAFLVRFYGAEPTDVPEVLDEQGSLIAALARQTEALTALVEELRASLQGVERGLEEAARYRREAESGSTNGPQVPEGAPR